MISKFKFAIVKKEKCNPDACGELCLKLCPINRTGEPCIVRSDEHGKVRIDEVLCTGCGICSNRCPFEAINIINLPKPPNKDPIHRYSENGFSLFGLISPVFGKIIGVIGRNGIGKSTSLNILSGYVKPNFGDYKSSGSDFSQRMRDYFKGTESQLFFEKLTEGKIKVSYKPQMVEQIPKMFHGTVNDLLRKSDETSKFDEVVDFLELKNILYHDISQLSGGELQKVAIAATYLKKADLYLFDEPSSYLDMSERLRVSSFIRSLSNPDNSIIVVDHDLIVQDYVSDLVVILYGKERAYGVVSNPLNSRVGINTFLSGYIKNENVQFRNHKIKYENLKDNVGKKGDLLIEWDNLKKRLGNFTISVDKGEIYNEDIIGIVGRNGIGKTTFMRILAGEFPSDSGSLTQNVKVSYKPQQIPLSNSQVIEFFSSVKNNVNTLVLVPLNIKDLFNKRLDQLSGGELQKVAIAFALSQEADIYLLDEPSAYLDVEDRLNVAKVIKSFMKNIGKSAIIIDHDLMFLDYFSEKIMVFIGTPAVEGSAFGPYSLKEGMNLFLKDLGVSFRRDLDSRRPKANKEGSKLDRMQKENGNYFY